MIDDKGARSLIAAILKQAHDDYTKDDACPAWCQFKGNCEDQKKSGADSCGAKAFIHSAWCATLCEGIDIDADDYIRTCIEKHRLSKNTYRYVENEIRLYKANEKVLKKLKDDIILSTSVAPEIRGSDIGDQTAGKALKLSLNKQIVEMERMAKAIRSIYDSLGDNKKTVMENFWDGQYTTRGLERKTGVDERTIRRWKQQIIYSVAVKLNYL